MFNSRDWDWVDINKWIGNVFCKGINRYMVVIN